MEGLERQVSGTAEQSAGQSAERFRTFSTFLASFFSRLSSSRNLALSKGVHVIIDEVDYSSKKASILVSQYRPSRMR